MKKIEKIIEYLIYLLVFLLPWQTRLILKQGMINGAVWEYGTYSLYLLDFLFAIIFILAFFYWLFRKKDNWKMHNKKVSDILGVVISFASIFWAEQHNLAIYYFLRLGQGIVLALIIYLISVDFKKIALALISASFIQSLLALWQFFSQKVVGSSLLGMANQLPQDAGVSVVEASFGRFLRAYGSLPHPNILAGFLVVSLIIILGLLIMSSTYRERYFLWLVAVVDFAALFFTFSKSAFLALALAYLFIFVFLYLTRDYGSKVTFYHLAMVGILVTAILGFIYSDLVFVRLNATERLEQQSVTDRITYLHQAQQILVNNWDKGVGIGNYTVADYNLSYRKFPGYEYQPVHNVYILILAELGVGGLLIFFLLIGAIIRVILNYRLEYNFELMEVFKEYKQQEMVEDYGFATYWFLVFTAILVAILTMFFFDHYFWTLYSGIVFFWLVLGLWLKQVRLNRI